MPVEVSGEVDLDLPAAMPADVVALGVESELVVIALEGRDGEWSAFHATPDQARCMAFALLEKAAIVESGSIVGSECG